MTEAEWIKCTDPTSMVEFLRGKASDRKLRLFACACCRRIWHLMADGRSRNAVEVAERFSDGLSSEAERAAVEHEAFFFDDFIASMDWLYGEGRTVTDPIAFTVAEAAVNAVCTHAGDSASFTARLALEAIPDEPARSDERSVQCRLLRDIIGPLPAHPVSLDPAWLAWSVGTVVKIAQGIYQERAFDRMPVLADALEDAGCDNADILDHLRSPGPHARGCWIVDLVLGKE